MYEGPIVAAYELQPVEERDTIDRIRSGPIAGIAVALPLSLAMWGMLYGIAHLMM